MCVLKTVSVCCVRVCLCAHVCARVCGKQKGRWIWTQVVASCLKWALGTKLRPPVRQSTLLTEPPLRPPVISPLLGCCLLHEQKKMYGTNKYISCLLTSEVIVLLALTYSG